MQFSIFVQISLIPSLEKLTPVTLPPPKSKFSSSPSPTDFFQNFYSFHFGEGWGASHDNTDFFIREIK